MQIEIISGSPRRESATRSVALHLHQLLLREYGIDSGLIDMQRHSLPYVDQVWSDLDGVPSSYVDIARRVFNAQGFILVTPEYNGSYSPALKNFLDHFPKQERKVFGIASASPGNLGGIRAAVQLQNLVSGLSGIGSPRMLIVPEVGKKFSKSGELSESSFGTSVHAFVEEFLWLTHALHAATEYRVNKLVA